MWICHLLGIMSGDLPLQLLSSVKLEVELKEGQPGMPKRIMRARKYTMAFWDSGAVILEDNVLHICKCGTDALQQQVERLHRNDLSFSLLLHTVLSSGAQRETQVQLQNQRHSWATELLSCRKCSNFAVLIHCILDKPWWEKCENTHRGWWESCQRQRHCLVLSLCFADLSQTAPPTQAQKTQIYFDCVDDIYIIVAQILQKSEYLSVCKPPVLSSWCWRSQVRTGPLWHRGNQDPASGPSLESTPWNIWDRHLHRININEGFCAKTKKKKKKVFPEIDLLDTRDVRVSCCSGNNADVS